VFIRGFHRGDGRGISADVSPRSNPIINKPARFARAGNWAC
jgi:hypothetical protein